MLNSLSKKRSCSDDSEETFSDCGEGLKDTSLEASEIAGKGGMKKKNAKKSKCGEAGAAKTVVSDAAS